MPSGDTRTIPTPAPWQLEDPSTYACHIGTLFDDLGVFLCTLITLGLLGVNSTSTHPLIDILGLYLMSKALRDVPYLAILPEKSTYLSKDYKGCSVSTITV